VAAPHRTLLFSPGFQQLLDQCLDQQIRLVEQVVRESHLQCCEFDDEFGCGAIATVGELDSERELCVRHFRQVNLRRALDEVSR
jgi:hypothetical protein